MAKKSFKPEQIVTLLPISFATDAEQLERYAVRFVLTKPFVAGVVLEAVAEVLGPTMG